MQDGFWEGGGLLLERCRNQPGGDVSALVNFIPLVLLPEQESWSTDASGGDGLLEKKGC